MAEIHVKALENKQAVGKRFIVTTEKPYSFQEMAKILKDEGYSKVSTKVAPNFFLRFMSNFSNDIKGMLPFIGFVYNADVSETIKTFDWTPIDLKKTVLDTAKSIAIDFAVSNTVFFKSIGVQSNVLIVSLTSALYTKPIKGSIPFMSLLKLDINLRKKFGATFVLTLL